MASIPQLVASALQHHQAGRLPEAEQIYRQILEVDPNQPDAFHLLGVIARQTGRNDIAVEMISHAIHMKGNVPDYHNNLGGAYLDLRRFPEAVASFRRAVQLKPDYALGLSNLGSALREVGQLQEAADCLRRAVRLDSELTDAHVNLGNVLRDQGKLENAIACYNRALERNPNMAITHNNLGNAQKDLGKFDSAITSYKRALELNPNFAEVYSNLGNVLKDQGKLDEAISNYYRALEMKPESFEAHNNLGNALIEQGKLTEATKFCRSALELRPDYASALNNLGNALKSQGKLEEAVACYRRVRELKPDDAEAHSNLLLSMQYCAGITLAALLDEHLEYDRVHAVPLRPGNQPQQDSRPKPARGEKTKQGAAQVPNVRDRLRLGFVSADLARHPVGNFSIRIFESLRDEAVDIICYSDRVVKDDLTQRFQKTAKQWRDIVGVSDASLANQIQADQIDILFDLSGHTAHNRLLVFARKPAPVQIAWIGYEGTTGLSAMDYLIADRYLIPTESERYYREKILRMPDGYLCYEPTESAPPANPLPLLKNGYPTFGSFNNLSKLSPQVIEVWSRILRRIPEARLVLKYRGLGDETVKQSYREAFAANGVDPQRIDLLPESSYADYLTSYHQVDLALDPFPFNGGATTCEALWMGVPVITCPGETFASRHSLSYLSTIGITETVTNSFDEYVDLAVSLASNESRLAELRAGLRNQMAASPLCDGKRFAGNFVALMRQVQQLEFKQ